MSANTTLHTGADRHEVSKQYNKVYAAIVALGADAEKTETIIRFLQSLEMHHIDAEKALHSVQTALSLDKTASARWHNEMNEMGLYGVNTMTTKKRPAVPKWQKPLTAADRRHLKETMDGRVTLAGFKRNREAQKRDGISCFECESIARKLGIN